jgi:predicted PhzF superfamily epimerase YddE/YHI9
MGAYYSTYIDRKPSGTYIIEQGQEMGRDGQVTVRVERTEKGVEVEIGGGSVFVRVLDLG